ncbi:MFS family permease [Hamadaea flava]|uniref:MFS transporter n=1 Tax=Hamadaea flava TaxID=1742688 RepID=A0ABV8M029_9ACTN|nr:MFS transporter [Hamadaea flava]MCP2329010.1 MFS family permease [Hamadaea flava]
MYLSTVDRPAATGAGRRWTAIGANVFALGLVSLVTDVSAEMVTAVLPAYLVLGLGLTPLAYGAVDGLYTGATAVLRLAGGWLADRTRQRKTVAGIGYGVSAVAKLGLLVMGTQTAAIGGVIAADRMGKGLRTAPRDALITLSAPPGLLGRAFGVHRTLDAAGAFLGPLVALGVLTATGSAAVTAASRDAFDAVFVCSFCVAAFGVLLLVLFVKEHRDPLAASRPRARDLAALAADPRARRLTAAGCVLGLATIGDGFVYLLLQRRSGLAIGWFPMLAVGTNLTYLLLAGLAGATADRLGRQRVLLGGYVLLAAIYLVLATPWQGTPMIAIVLLLNGAFYASTDGVLMALAGPVLPQTLRTTGLAMIQTGQAVAYLGSSVLFGLVWQRWDTTTAVLVAFTLTLLAGVATAVLVRPRAR